MEGQVRLGVQAQRLVPRLGAGLAGQRRRTTAADRPRACRPPRGDRSEGPGKPVAIEPGKGRQWSDLMQYMIFRIEFRHFEPKIWRTIAVFGNAATIALHDAIQRSGEWWSYHLWDLSKGNKRVAISHPDEDGADENVPLAEEVELCLLFPREGAKLRYRYDYGDNWELDVVYEGTREIRGKRSVYLILDGQRAFPPEDAGGVHGYYDCLAVVGELPSDHLGAGRKKELRDWLGNWDPNRVPTFDKV